MVQSLVRRAARHLLVLAKKRRAAGCVHEPVVVGSGKAAVERPEFRWVNTILGNIKNALRGTYHAIRPKYAQRYLSEFEYRFNRRFDLPDIIPRLVYVALRTPPMPERLLKLPCRFYKLILSGAVARDDFL